MNTWFQSFRYWSIHLSFLIFLPQYKDVDDFRRPTVHARMNREQDWLIVTVFPFVSHIWPMAKDNTGVRRMTVHTTSHYCWCKTIHIHTSSSSSVAHEWSLIAVPSWCSLSPYQRRSPPANPWVTTSFYYPALHLISRTSQINPPEDILVRWIRRDCCLTASRICRTSIEIRKNVSFKTIQHVTYYFRYTETCSINLLATLKVRHCSAYFWEVGGGEWAKGTVDCRLGKS